MNFAPLQSGVNNFHYPSDSERFGLLNGMALSVILLMQLSYDVCIKSASAKLVFLPGCLFAYLLFTYYTSELTAGTQQRPLSLNGITDTVTHTLPTISNLILCFGLCLKPVPLET